jgi:sigma-B regulation protein RsbU (phosphoserine phosphatase)
MITAASPDLGYIIQTMREISRHTDPQQMVANYVQRIRQIIPMDRHVSLSRRDLARPYVRITRSTTWERQPNPWKQTDRLPLIQGGLLSELIYGEEPRIINDLLVDPSDPARDYLHGMGSILALPLYDQGLALNMVVWMRKEKDAFTHDRLAELVWMSNIFGRATSNLALSQQVRELYQQVDREMQVVADIQRSLLPAELPSIPTLHLAAHYQTSRRAGGDYYDFFELPGGKWGLLIADVSGHGTPAAVIMAVTHSIAHTHEGDPEPPSRLLNFINRHLTARYTLGRGTFVTAFYGIYDPSTLRLTYASAGHNPPRVRACGGKVRAMTEGRRLPLGIDPDERYIDAVEQFADNEVLVLYTDGITEARKSDADEMFGAARLDELLADCLATPRQVVDRIVRAVEDFTGGQPPGDDRTLLVGRVQGS